jgi:hypothetical protein
MNVDKLEELQQIIESKGTLSPEDCVSLVGEIWRLKTSITAKDLEINYWRDGHGHLKHELESMTHANQLLQNEVDELKSVHGLPVCELENRWSNCAVRMRKRSEMLARKETEMISQPQIDRNHSSLRRFAGFLFKSSPRHKSV